MIQVLAQPRVTLFPLLVLIFLPLLASCAPPSSESAWPPLTATASIATEVAVIELVPPAIETNAPQPTHTRTPAPTSIPFIIDSTATPVTIETTATLQPTTSTPTPGLLVEKTATVTPTATIMATATYWPTVTRQVLASDVSAGLVTCDRRSVSDDLLAVVTQQFSLPENFVPPDLVLLSDFLPGNITRDQELYVRAVMVEPLQQMVTEMHTAGLEPSILSAYRSYGEQALAWRWWNSQYPGRVAIMSARPGRSEHQLGTTVDFGSPELDHLFHVDFADTAEGVWLTNNAYRFGFTLSYPVNAYDITGFKYEPWHFRFVGTDLAQQLWHSGQILTQWQLTHLPAPCIP